MSNSETGGDLYNLAKYARLWFIENNVNIPKNSTDWQQSSVRREEIPPKCSTGNLRKLGISTRVFIDAILEKPINLDKYKNNPINKTNISDRLGLEWLSEYTIKKHKRIKVRCLSCRRVDTLDYGTLSRVCKRADKYCMNCRNVGGKEKDIATYNVHKDFEALYTENQKVHLKCKKCEKEIIRGFNHVKISEYLVCEYCHPNTMTGAKIETDFGRFDSKIEYLVYLKLITILDKKDIIRQKSYDELFNTKTRHTADFYIPKLDLVLEITTKSNNIGEKYKETAIWKLKVSNKVKFAYSVKEAEDIVRTLAKVRGYPLQTAEMYIAAVLSKDTALQKVFSSGGDFHSSVAHMVFKLECHVSEVKKLYPKVRQGAKAVSFGILFGASAKKIAQQVDITLEEAEEVIRQYFKTFHKLDKWLKTQQKLIRRDGLAYSHFGRKRRLLNVFSDNGGIVGHDVRSGVNFLIQSVASDVNLFAAVELQKWIKANNMKTKIFALVHDSILAEVYEPELDAYIKKMGELTQKDRGVSIKNCPIGLDVEIGDTYAFD